MEQGEITRTIARYLGERASRNELVSALPGDGYFIFYDNSESEGRGPNLVMKGSALDILAWSIEEERFFGDYVPKDENQAKNCNNSRLTKITEEGYEFNGSIKLTPKKEQLVPEVIKIAPREYLEDLRSKEGFVRTAKLLDMPEPERMANHLYTN
tara:strand:+ start:248 stop:712 length:465 start_codon:yes stop_codon:yes gene_type:complete